MRVLSRAVGSGDATPQSDNSLKKFYKGLLQKFSEEQPTLWAGSNITDPVALL